MARSALHGTAVGIVANPSSGRDIRRLVARASVFPIAEKCNIILRLLSALGVVGIKQVFIMPDVGGITDRLRRAIASSHTVADWPDVKFLDMVVEDGPGDTIRAVTHMINAGVGAIVVLGGDGTHRLVASVCGETPILALSTGTNNVFPEIREATVAGMAAGLVAAGRVSKAEGSWQNKVLEVFINGISRGLAVVDVSVSTDAWVGSKALWQPEALSQIFVTFAEPAAIGLSSVAGLVHPVSRMAKHGLRLDIGQPGTAEVTVRAPIAPGLIVPVGVNRISEIHADEPQCLQIRQGVIALDGEREMEFMPDQQVRVQLRSTGPVTIDTEQVMLLAAEKGLLLDMYHRRQGMGLSNDTKKENSFAYRR
jgi:predicted polyphosphate/ATP-dependent NAD kinase